jgi:hypothetical protein
MGFCVFKKSKILLLEGATFFVPPEEMWWTWKKYGSSG